MFLLPQLALVLLSLETEHNVKTVYQNLDTACKTKQAQALFAHHLQDQSFGLAVHQGTCFVFALFKCLNLLSISFLALFAIFYTLCLSSLLYLS